MTGNENNNIDLGAKQVSLRDLADFCQNWDDIKLLIDDEELKKVPLSESQRQTILWLRTLADRVCRFDDLTDL